MKMDFTGKKFGACLALAIAGHSGMKTTWRVRCDCGAERVILSSHIRRGSACRSCANRIHDEKVTLHGLSNTPEHRSWLGMIGRCTNERGRPWKHYGGRGIKVCERWQEFKNFLEDMGPKPSLRHSLDRFPNNDGDYEPGNCRWATPTEQSRNRRNTRHITIGGVTRSTGEWAERAGIAVNLIHSRLRTGCAPERLLRPSRFLPPPEQSP